MAELKHGTRGGYVNHKCRCEACREANREWVREYAARRRALGIERTLYTLTCMTCGEEFQGRHGARACSPACATSERLTTLVQNEDWQAVMDLLLVRTEEADGCRVWVGAYRDREKGYPVVTVNNKTVLAHRLMLQAKHDGRPLGVLHGHHVCANNRCINPDHLVPATAAENAAEMLARQSYEARIRELEAVIREVAPDHEVLHRVPVNGAS